MKTDPSNYDLLIIGTPIWSSNLSAPVRTYITQNRGKFHNLAFFITAGGFKFDGVFLDIREVS